MLTQAKIISSFLIIGTIFLLQTSMDCSPVQAAGMQEDTDQAVSILERFQEIPENSIPPAIVDSLFFICGQIISRVRNIFSIGYKI